MQTTLTFSTTRPYTHYSRPTISYLQQHYSTYTLKELEAQLGIPWRKIMKLAEREGIRKRARNGTVPKTRITHS